MVTAGIVVQITSARVFPGVKKALRPGRPRYFTMNQTSPASTSTNAIPVMIRIAMNNPSIGPANVAPYSGSHNGMVQPPSFSSLRCNREVLCFRLAPGPGAGGGLCPVPPRPGLDRIRPGRQPFDREAAVRAAHAVERVRQDAEPRMHPAVHVALERYHHLGRRERARRGHSGGLADVEGAVLRALRLDVVQDAVGVLDLEVLTHHDAQHVRVVAAPILVQRHRPRRGGGLVSRRQARLHGHEDVRERAVGVHHHHFLGGRRLILRLALRLLSHVDLRVRRLGPGELDVAGDRRAALRGLARPRREAHDPHTYCNRCYGTELAHRSSCMRIPNPPPPPPLAPHPANPRAPRAAPPTPPPPPAPPGAPPPPPGGGTPPAGGGGRGGEKTP